MTISQQLERVGNQTPRIRHLPDGVISNGAIEAIELAETAGLYLFPWQQLVLTDMLGERAGGKWAAFEAAFIVPRQNGKGAILEARELAALFLFNEKKVVHSAHRMVTAKDALKRLGQLIETGNLGKRVLREIKTHGEEGYELVNGSRITFQSRSKQGGRGLQGDLIVLDEAFNLGRGDIAALMPTLSTVPNPQLVYASTPGDIKIAPCDQLASVRRRGIAGEEPDLYFAEWSVPHDDKTGKILADPNDLDTIADCNPSAGTLITWEYLRKEARSLGKGAPRQYATERLGVGDWPADEEADGVIAEFIWNVGLDADSHVTDRMMFAVDMPPELGSASIAVAGFYAYLEGHEPAEGEDDTETIAPVEEDPDDPWGVDGEVQIDESKVWHVETVMNRGGTQWVVPKLKELCEKWETSVVIDVRSPAASLIPELEAQGVPFVPINTSELYKACAIFYQLAVHQDEVSEEYEPLLRHLDQASLAIALKGTQQKFGISGWKFERKPDTGVDISPLIAAVLALYGAIVHAEDNYNVLDSFY